MKLRPEKGVKGDGELKWAYLCFRTLHVWRNNLNSCVCPSLGTVVVGMALLGCMGKAADQNLKTKGCWLSGVTALYQSLVQHTVKTLIRNVHLLKGTHYSKDLSEVSKADWPFHFHLLCPLALGLGFPSSQSRVLLGQLFGHAFPLSLFPPCYSHQRLQAV